jgi:hypothetical protein
MQEWLFKSFFLVLLLNEIKMDIQEICHINKIEYKVVFYLYLKNKGNSTILIYDIFTQIFLSSYTP